MRPSERQDGKIEVRMEAIRTGLRRIMGEFLRKQPPEEAAVLAWPVVCGPEVASRTRALGFSDGRLTVEVLDAIWRTQLATFAARYISGLDELLPKVVKEVRFQIADRNTRDRVIRRSGDPVI